TGRTDRRRQTRRRRSGGRAGFAPTRRPARSRPSCAPPLRPRVPARSVPGGGCLRLSTPHWRSSDTRSQRPMLRITLLRIFLLEQPPAGEEQEADQGRADDDEPDDRAAEQGLEGRAGTLGLVDRQPADDEVRVLARGPTTDDGDDRERGRERR